MGGKARQRTRTAGPQGDGRSFVQAGPEADARETSSGNGKMERIARQRGSGALRTDAARREPLSEVGVCRSGQLGGSESHAVSGKTRQPTRPPVAPAQGTREGDRSRGPAFG